MTTDPPSAAPNPPAPTPGFEPAALGPSPLSAGAAELPVDQAQARLLDAVRAHRRIRLPESLPLLQASGRVLAADLHSSLDVPPHDNSAMDGYAFAGAALQPGQPTRLRCTGSLMAGVAPAQEALPAGCCVRIMTGAVMPEGADTVVPFELCHRLGDEVEIPADRLRAGENRRRRGEDLASGRVALRAGRRLQPSDLGLAASLGLTHLPVWPRLRVALFSTGDELVEPGQPLKPGSIYDSNRVSLGAALSRLPFDVIDLGQVPDDPDALQAALERAAAADADAVVTSGGVSAGDADHTRAVLERGGSVDFWKVAMRPGRPFAFGSLAGGALFFGLPGNPVAALVTFYALARDALLCAAGAMQLPRVRLQARCAVAIRKRPGRTEFQRGVLSASPDAGWSVAPTGSQGAGVLSSMSQANALLVLGHGQASIAAGDWVEVWPFEGML